MADGDSRETQPESGAVETAVSSVSRRRVLLGTAAVGATSMVIGAGSSASNAPPRLHVDGKWLQDPDDEPVTLRGLNTVDPWWGTRYQQMGDASYRDVLKRITDADRGWYPRVIRIPCQHSINSVGVQRTVDEYLRPLVDFFGQRDCYVIIDFHRIERWDTETIDQDVRQFWNVVAPAFAEDDHVLYELFNEPTKPFGDGKADWRRWRETAQPWVDLVRSHAPDTPLIIGSPRWSTYTKYANSDPFAGDNLVYAAHLYPAHFETYDLAALRATAANRPVFVTEWGYVADQSKPAHVIGRTSGYGQSIREYFERIPNLNWAAWCADSMWSPAMFHSDGTLRSGDRYMGAFTKRFLAAARTSEQSTG